MQQVRRKVDAISRGKDQLIRLCGESIFRQNVTAAMCDCNFMLIMSFLKQLLDVATFFTFFLS